MKTAQCVLLSLFMAIISGYSLAKEKPSDDAPIDITSHAASTQVFPPEYATELGREQARLEAVNARLDSIDASVKEMRSDIKELTETSHVVNFVLGSLKIFV